MHARYPRPGNWPRGGASNNLGRGGSFAPQHNCWILPLHGFPPWLAIASIWMLIDVPMLQNLPFQNVKHETATIDPMPGFGDSGVLIQVTGFIVVRCPTTLPIPRLPGEKRQLQRRNTCVWLKERAGSCCLPWCPANLDRGASHAQDAPVMLTISPTHSRSMATRRTPSSSPKPSTWSRSPAPATSTFRTTSSS